MGVCQLCGTKSLLSPMLINYRTSQKKLLWNLKQKTMFFFQGNTEENVFCVISAIFFRPQCVNSLKTDNVYIYISKLVYHNHRQLLGGTLLYLLSIEIQPWKFAKIWINKLHFHFMKKYMKILSVKYCPFCSGFNMLCNLPRLTHWPLGKFNKILDMYFSNGF